MTLRLTHALAAAVLAAAAAGPAHAITITFDWTGTVESLGFSVQDSAFEPGDEISGQISFQTDPIPGYVAGESWFFYSYTRLEIDPAAGGFGGVILESLEDEIELASIDAMDLNYGAVRVDDAGFGRAEFQVSADDPLLWETSVEAFVDYLTSYGASGPAALSLYVNEAEALGEPGGGQMGYCPDTMFDDCSWSIDFDSFTLAETSPVPLPAAAPLLAAGLGGLVWLGRRRRG